MLIQKILVTLLVLVLSSGQSGLPVAVASLALEPPLPVSAFKGPEATIPPGSVNRLILIQMPDLTSEETMAALELPPSLLPEHAQLFAERLLRQAAEVQIHQLEASQPPQQNQPSHYRFRPDLAAIEIVSDTAQSPNVVPSIPTNASAKVTECDPQIVAELAKQLMALRQYQIMREAEPETRMAFVDGLAAAPHIILTSYAIFGTAPPHTLVTLRLVRNGALISIRTTKSHADGQFTFYPQHQSCPTPGYDWQLMLGDTVTVEANGETASTQVTQLSVEADPTTNRIFGVTTPSHVVTLKLFQPSVNCSEVALVTRTVQADAFGNFSLDLTASYDFDNSAYVIAESSERAGGHAIQARANAFGIRMYPSGASIYFILPHGVPYTATLWRGDTAITRQVGRMIELAYAFYTDAQPGDVWVVEGGGLRFSMMATQVTANLNLAADRIQVTTQANRHIRAYLYFRSSYAYASDSTTNCGQSQRCSFGITDGSGNFSIAANTDLVRGDTVYVESFDPQGNRLIGSYIGTHSILARLNSYYNISVHWVVYANNLHILHKDASGAIKSEFEHEYSDLIDVHSDAGVVPGDVIEAGDGVLTETMTVQAIDARLDSNRNLLTGAGSDGPLSALLTDFDPGTYSLTSRCAHSRTGKLPLAFPKAQLGGNDYGWVMRMGSDGHYTERFLKSFSVYVNQINSPYVFIQVVQPGTSVTLTLRAGDVVKNISTTETGNQDFAYVYYSGDSSAFATGDTLDVATSDGSHASITITNLNIAFEGEPNHAFGTAPANQRLLVEAWRSGPFPSSWIVGNVETSSDTNGHFDIGLSPEYLRKYCVRVSLSHPCVSGRVTYYTPAGHGLSARSRITPIAPDRLEPDNTFTQATSYIAPQTHTLHTTSDVDLVAFTISPEDVNRRTTYQIQLSELGWNMNISADVYDASYRPLATKTEREHDGSSIGLEWTPQSAGQYYLYISSGDAYSGGSCDSSYTLTLFPIRTRLHFPEVWR